MDLEHHDIVIVGAGFAGLGTAIELRRAGREDVVVLERADALGGTWHANHYPGCACDVPTPYYSYSFAPKADWSRLYAPHHEIRAYLEDCAGRFGVRSRIRLCTRVTALDWDAAAGRWVVEVDGAPAMTARAVAAAPGGLSRPAYPDVDGLGDFAGPWFHSAGWDHTVELAGARVAVIGTGASAIQFVPEVARRAAHVDVFQRTPPWVLPKLDARVAPWQQRLFRGAPASQKAVRGAIWGLHEWMGLGNTVDQRLTRPLEAIGRWSIRRAIADPDLRRRVTPDWAIGCKRVLLSNDWYPTLAQRHVEVVTDRVERITARGLVTAGGDERPADVIVFGTGFKATDPVGDLPIRGRDGDTLAERWRRSGMVAHRGTTFAGFPNFFLMPGPNTGTGHASQIFMIEAQIRHVVAALQRMDERGAGILEPTAEAQDAFNRRLEERMRRTVWLRGGCTSWYLDEHGRNTTLWPFSTLRFRRELATIDDREFRFAPATVPALTEVPA